MLRCRPIAPGGGVRTIDLFLDSKTQRASLHDYVEPVQRNPVYVTAANEEYAALGPK